LPSVVSVLPSSILIPRIRNNTSQQFTYHCYQLDVQTWC
jgi:hypothetical protein